MSNAELEAADIAVLFDRNRLRIARELRGLSQVQLAREAGSVTSGSLSQFESGHTRPSAATLRRLSVALRVPLRFFAAPAQPSRPESVSGFFRSLRSTSPRDRQQALAYVQLARELALELEKFVTLPELDLPRTTQPLAEIIKREEIEALAQDVRNHWNIPSGPIDDVVRTLERNGIVTIRFRVSLEKVDAFCVDFPDRPVIALGADKGLRDRSRFDGTHELGHLIMHSADQVGTKSIETQANEFAAAFLMPAEDIRDELPARADWPALLKLKAQWHVSIAALLVRAKTLGVMDEQTYTQAWKTMSVRGWRKREPGHIGTPESPVLLRRALDVAANTGMTFGNLIGRAGLPENDIRAILGDNSDERPRVEL
ncbi:MAG: ImmA/IrrE family metallo-endopeptidase [Pseudonocardiales bacterium]|nr:ImmA/IrrE family metallo-endopeptidase [Pseudonocardiales bacterium]